MTFNCHDMHSLKVPLQVSNSDMQSSDDMSWALTSDTGFIKSASANFLLPFEVDEVLVKLQQKYVALHFVVSKILELTSDKFNFDHNLKTSRGTRRLVQKTTKRNP
jgi:hypothetical protein